MNFRKYLLTNKKIQLTASLVVLLSVLTPVVALAQGEANVGGVFTFFWGFVNTVFGNLLAGSAGVLLNTSIELFVVGFGELYLTEGGFGVAIELAWVSIRDVFNITFIFGLVYIGFKMILNSDDSQTKKWLINLIMAALLVNFSLYITKFIVDLSNSLATEIVSATFVNTDTGQVAVSDTFLNSMGVNSLFSSSEIPRMAELSPLGFIFGAMMLFIVMFFAFGAGALLITIRFATLMLYMVFSPLMFIGWVFPQLQRYTDQFWSGFLGRAFFAPIYLLLLYVSVLILESGVNAAEGANGPVNILGSTQGQGQESLQQLNAMPLFLVSAIFLIASIVVAQKMGAVGAQATSSGMKKLTGKLTAGAAAYGGRKIIGGLGNMAAENKSVQEWAKRKGRAGLGGRLIADVANVARTSSFDARNAPGVASTLGTGTGRKGGLMADYKAKEKKEEDRAKRYSTQEDDSLYEAAGAKVHEIKEEYSKVIDNIDDIMGALANATEAGEKRKLMIELAKQETRKKEIETGKKVDENGKEQDLDNKDDYTQFNYLRKNNQKIQQEGYASNLESRGSSLPPIIKQIVTSPGMNRAAAQNIRKKNNRTDVQKLADQFADATGDKGGKEDTEDK